MIGGLNLNETKPGSKGWVRSDTKEPVYPAIAEEPKIQDDQAGIPSIDAANALLEKMGEDVLGCENQKALKEFIKNFSPRYDGVIVNIDLSDFKSVNDAHGHHAGDKILQELVDQLNQNFRIKNSEDRLFRSGGDEFILICQHINPKTSQEDFVRKIKSKLKKIKLQTTITKDNKKNHIITAYFDFGVEIYLKTEGKNTKTDFAESMIAADKKMYRKKRMRRKIREAVI